MIKKIYTWYTKLPLYKQLIALFMCNWIAIFIGWFIGDKVFFDTPHSLSELVFKSTFSACTSTVFFNWGKIKELRRQLVVPAHEKS